MVYNQGAAVEPLYEQLEEAEDADHQHGEDEEHLENGEDHEETETAQPSDEAESDEHEH